MRKESVSIEVDGRGDQSNRNQKHQQSAVINVQCFINNNQEGEDDGADLRLVM